MFVEVCNFIVSLGMHHGNRSNCTLVPFGRMRAKKIHMKNSCVLFKYNLISSDVGQGRILSRRFDQILLLGKGQQPNCSNFKKIIS